MNTVNRKFHRDTNAGPIIIDKVLTESLLQCVLSTFGRVCSLQLYSAGINVVI